MLWTPSTVAISLVVAALLLPAAASHGLIMNVVNIVILANPVSLMNSVNIVNTVIPVNLVISMTPVKHLGNISDN